MPANGNDTTIADGSLDFSGGVDSISVTTVAGSNTQTGLQRNQLAWLDNATVRDGGILQRTGWNLKGTIHAGNVLYQGGFMYEPLSAFPYLIVLLSGNVWQVDPDFATPPINLSAKFALTLPPTQPKAFFAQAEEFLVIQSGDLVTLPLFWDGTILRRSKGITTATPPPMPSNGINEIPAAGPMDYYQGRLWYAQNRLYNAGDIVYGPSGSGKYNFRDSVLNVTENPLALGGDGFAVPTNAGNIRALKHSANLDTTLGQGQLFIFTRKSIYALQVPVTRNDWIAATNNNQPVQTVVQLVNGSVNDTSVVAVNGDLFYQTLQPSIASLITAVRYFNQWGNIPVSANEERILQFNNRALMFASSGIQFDNRLLETVLPVQRPQGVIHQAIIPLDFTPLSKFGAGFTPIWEGMYEGLDILQLLEADFGGLERAFATNVSRQDQSIQLWELTSADRDDHNKTGPNRVTWYLESPAYTWDKEFLLKKLVSAELWLDKISGQVIITVEYRPDSSTCWLPWHKFDVCAARNTCEDVHNPVCYPLTEFREGYRQTLTLPKPPTSCESMTGRPSNIGYQFQVKLTFKGWCRLRGLLVHAEPVERKLYQNITC